MLRCIYRFRVPIVNKALAHKKGKGATGYAGPGRSMRQNLCT